jgi:hypothetical protein
MEHMGRIGFTNPRRLCSVDILGVSKVCAR